MRHHTIYGEEILRDLPGITEEALHIAGQHHERMDGSGYPRGLQEAQIHRWGQLTAVADVYDGMTSARAYKASLLPSIALGQIYRKRDEKFPGEIVDLFVKCVGIYPVGSLVLLNTGEVGIVCEPNPENACCPQVGVVISRDKKLLPSPKVVSLDDLQVTENREIVKVLDPEDYAINVDRLLKAMTR